MEIKRGCGNCAHIGLSDDCEECEGCYQWKVEEFLNFKPNETIVELQNELQQTQAKLKKALDAIESHEVSVTNKWGTMDTCGLDGELWKVLEELKL